MTSAMFKERSITAARKIYIHRCSSEAEENVKFQTFVHNYQAANQGKNTQRHQLTFARNSKRVSKKQGKEIISFVLCNFSQNCLLVAFYCNLSISKAMSRLRNLT